MTAVRQPTKARLAVASRPLRSNLLQRKCQCGIGTPAGEECSACKRNHLGLQRKTSAESARPEVPSSIFDVLRSSGRSLDPASRAFFEPRFGYDFSRVRVHSDASAAMSARAVGALAYTVGQHVVFGSNQYDSATPAGKQLLAHELAHVAQQNASPNAPVNDIRIEPASDGLEREAESVAQDIVAGHSHGPLTEARQSLARQTGAKKKCPSTHAIPDDIYKAIGEAWNQSGQAGATVTERGGRVVTDKAGKRAIRTGAGGGGSISLPAEETGDVTLGTFHTHPYSKTEGSKLGVGFSGGDIENFVAGGQGSAKYVGAGTCIYALDTLDLAARDGCKSVDIKKRWDDRFAAAGGNFQMKVDAAVRSSIAGCGVCYYGACSPSIKSAVPKTGTLG